MPPVGPVTGLAMAVGEAFIDEDVRAQVTQQNWQDEQN
jgi:hypothetical protein